MRSDFASNQTNRIEDVCQIFGLTRDAWYKQLYRKNSKLDKEKQVVKAVQDRRSTLPFEGLRKLHLSILPGLNQAGLTIGRDALWRILQANDLLIKRKKKYVRTTDSDHAFYRYNNLIEQLTPSRPNQIWVADITYISTLQGFLYLALITDAYSRKIIGYDISDSLEMLGAERALKMALGQRKTKLGTIHHSDHGIQYCSNNYTNKLKNNNINISMGEIGNCYENAMAERINGILKEEFKLDHQFKTKGQAIKATRQAVLLYNTERKHMKLDYKTPEDVHRMAA